ncbi:hypothetical protein [Aurantiacibacter poecillastricola]|uniref:hypothetical protein n=1 Tax=Aurantiacibacter poecillastricola TaxID=3064385 RepID=UPI00273D4550|nr:hypothetical protein [Aurantiacibacter sp. 219JJ12-13]MDP5260110.1 hypothetical protein [Aurantiacibacter sp. 219JJ12-13]
MADSTHDSDRIMQEASRSLSVQREGGFHRRGTAIGEGSARLRKGHFTKRLIQGALAVFAILVAAGVVGMIIDGIGFAGVMLTALAIMCAMIFFASRKVEVPRREDLTRTKDARQLVARTELWLESQRPALPPPAVKLVDDLGVQLDALGTQLEHVDPAHPAAAETRKLVGEYLPETIDSYNRIPAHLRREERAGSTPDKQLVDSLGKISREIDTVTRQLAEGSLDDLAVRNRYLDYKYGGEDTSLPPPDKEP